MKKNIFYIAILLLISNYSFAQRGGSSSTPPSFTAIEQQSDYLDSLVNNWYIKRSINNTNYDVQLIPDFLMEETTDSLYMARLKTIASPIQLSYNEKVRSWINLYLKKNRRTPYLLGLSDYYFPIFEEILDYHQIPLEFKYLPIIESALNPRARSRAGAVGLWQFMYSTGKMYGLEVNSYVDERSDPLKASHAAARFLKDMYKIYGDWTLVLAAYNCGAGNVNKAIRRSGGSRDYWEIYPYLPKETRGYVPAFMGALYVVNFYEEHNIVPQRVDMNVFTDTVMITEKLHLKQVSEKLNIPYEQLIELNPQYKKFIIPGNYKPYPLRLPVKEIGNFIASASEIYTYKDSLYLSSNDLYIKPPVYNKSSYKSYSHSSSSSNYAPPTTAGKVKLVYSVKQGDTYGFISSWYNVRISDIKYWNNTYSNRLSISQKLNVWVPKSKVNYYKRINAMSFASKQALKGKVTSSSSSSNVASTTKPNDKKFIWYKVRKGDSLWTIAQKYNGISDGDIKKINNFTSRDIQRLRAGQYIKIKRKG